MPSKGRPKKYRIVRLDPRISQFSPRGKAGRPEETNISMDEFEAIRLCDFLGLSQKEASKSMRVSQPTFSRILKKARRTLADGIIRGKILKIQGGFYVFSSKYDQPQEAART